MDTLNQIKEDTKEEQFIELINKLRAENLKNKPCCLIDSNAIIEVDKVLIIILEKFKQIFDNK